MPIERKLAAIMFTDIAGYTAQMSKDEVACPPKVVPIVKLVVVQTERDTGYDT